MAITLTTDPIIESKDAQALFGLTDETRAAVLINSLSAKFLNFTGRKQINKDVSTAIVENVRGWHGAKLWLRSTPVWLFDDEETPGALDVKVEMLEENTVSATYLLSNDDFRVVEADNFSSIEMFREAWPAESDGRIARVTYYGGWAEVPGDVIEGALVQGKVDLKRTDGQAGMTSHSANGESISFESAGLIKAVRDLWNPYRVVV